jgi:hypothetical protein
MNGEELNDGYFVAWRKSAQLPKHDDRDSGGMEAMAQFQSSLDI